MGEKTPEGAREVTPVPPQGSSRWKPLTRACSSRRPIRLQPTSAPARGPAGRIYTARRAGGLTIQSLSMLMVTPPLRRTTGVRGAPGSFHLNPQPRGGSIRHITPEVIFARRRRAQGEPVHFRVCRVSTPGRTPPASSGQTLGLAAGGEARPVGKLPENPRWLGKSRTFRKR